MPGNFLDPFKSSGNFLTPLKKPKNLHQPPRHLPSTRSSSITAPTTLWNVSKEKASTHPFSNPVLMSIRLFSQSSVTRLSYERVFFIVHSIFILIHDLIYIHDGGKDCSPILSATRHTKIFRQCVGANCASLYFSLTPK
jgi:hypothetical protein